jgi:outer membrane protein W
MRLLLILLLAIPLHAADIELGIRHLSMRPMGDGAFEGGELDIVSSRGFGATAEVFWTPRISTQLAGTLVNPAAFIHESGLDLGTFGIDTYSLTARYHVRTDSRLSAFVGAGPAMVLFGDLEDRFGDDVEMTFDAQTALLGEAGVRYHIFPAVFLDVAVSYMPVEATPNHVRNDTNIALPEVVQVDPFTISVGASWRF